MTTRLGVLAHWIQKAEQAGDEKRAKECAALAKELGAELKLSTMADITVQHALCHMHRRVLITRATFTHDEKVQEKTRAQLDLISQLMAVRLS